MIHLVLLLLLLASSTLHGVDDGNRQPHWAFKAPVRPAIPAGTRAQSNPIDAFVRAKLAARKLMPSGEADRRTLLRRVTLDLTGLPPTPSEVSSFLLDNSGLAYERAVDRLLSSPGFGERMAQDWLDAARFADSNGYQVDRDRDLWAWRDWVVHAFNQNLPFDRFTVEQLAGDLLPNPTLDQKIATGFNRNHMINEEGGIIPEEFLAEYCADRVETTATVWLGLTFNCARCHDHKYDPFTQRDYYGMLAFFHNISESGVGDYGAHYRHSTPPFLKLPSPDQAARLAAAEGEHQRSNAVLTNLTAKLLAGAAEWEGQVRRANPSWRELEIRNPIIRPQVNQGSLTSATLDQGWLRILAGTTNRLSIRFEVTESVTPLTFVQIEFANTSSSGPSGSNRLSISNLRLKRPGLANQTALQARSRKGLASADEAGAAVDGKLDTAWSFPVTGTNRIAACFHLPNPEINESAGAFEVELDLSAQVPGSPWKLRLLSSSAAPELLPSPSILTILDKPETKRSDDERKRIEEFRLAQFSRYSEQKRQVAELKKRADEANAAIPVTLVMSEMDRPRDTFVLKRGAYDQRGIKVAPSTPASLPGMSESTGRNRLGLARWLTDPANPLTARVTVNRFWQSFFGQGIVKTAEDFGVQGEPPTHPELLDWLATEFIRSGWDVKALIRLIVTSSTYRQDSRSTPELLSTDPENRWLARGPRYRLSAEVIRDQALLVSGSLLSTLGGPPVRPYHPPGLYEQVVAGSSASTYVQDHGDGLYRRTLYTYWKRSVPNPALLLFDRPFRETCVVRRARTSTPLQALNLMNDPTYVESARLLAQRILREGGSLAESRVQFAVRTVLAREAKPGEMSILMQGMKKMRASFEADPEAARQLVSVGESRPDLALGAVNLAVYTTLASTLLNLDETITKE